MSQTVQFVAPEELARANFYALIARLFYASPDAQLVAELRQAQPIGGEGMLAAAWREMVEACASAFPVTLENEHTVLFVGTGKAEVTPYLSHYVMKYSSENPLVELRQQLSAWRIGRREEVPEYEDHISGIFEAMRFAIATQQRSYEEQRKFFGRFIYPGASAFCNAVIASPNARFYRPVARVAHAFLEIEKTAFEMDG
jgi:TorA maturation chaperone TorD